MDWCEGCYDCNEGGACPPCKWCETGRLLTEALEGFCVEIEPGEDVFRFAVSAEIAHKARAALKAAK